MGSYPTGVVLCLKVTLAMKSVHGLDEFVRSLVAHFEAHVGSSAPVA